MKTNKYFVLFIVSMLAINCTSSEKKDLKVENKIYNIVEELRIENPKEGDQFYYISAGHIAIANNGNIFIGDSRLPTISMFDKEGKFVKTIGREGRGPGEYLNIGGLDVMPDGRIALWDQRNGKASFFTEDGEYLESLTIPISFFSAKVFEAGLNGNLYFKSALFDVEKREIKDLIWVEYNTNGEILDSLLIPSEAFADQKSYVISTSNGYEYPFTTTNVSTIHPSGYLVSGNNSEYAIKTLYKELDKIEFSRNIPKIKVKNEEKPQWETYNRKFQVDNEIPDKKPYYKAITTDVEGRVWVRKYIEAELNQTVNSNDEKWWERPTFDVFKESGEFFGTVALPKSSFFLEAKGEKIWVNHTEINEEEIVIQYKMELKEK